MEYKLNLQEQHYADQDKLKELLRRYWNFKNEYYQSFHDEEWYALAEAPDAGTRLAAAIFYYHDCERRLDAIRKAILATHISTLRYKVYDWVHLDLLRKWDRHPIEKKQRLTDDESECAIDELADIAHNAAWKSSPEQIHRYVLNERDDVIGLDDLLTGVSIDVVIRKAAAENARKLRNRMARRRRPGRRLTP